MPLQVNITDYQSAIISHNMKYSMLILLLSQVIDSWELISTEEKKKNLAKKHFDSIKKKTLLIMLSPGGLLLPQGMEPNQKWSVGIYLWQVEHNSHTKIILDEDLTPALLAQTPSCCQGPLISRSTKKHQDSLQN